MSSHFGPALERVIVPPSSRHARKRQRKIASKLRVRFGCEEQSAVGMMEGPEADLECSGMLDGLAADLGYPLQSGSGWCGMETDSKENVLEWTVDDFDEKVIDEVVEAKRSNRSELGVVFTCLNPARKVQENSVETRRLTLDTLTTKTML